MIMEYDIKVGEAKLKIEELTSEMASKLSKTLKLFKNLVSTLQKTEEKTDQKTCVWLCEMRYLSSASSLAEVQKYFG